MTDTNHLNWSTQNETAALPANSNGQSETAFFEIRIKGRLDSSWSDWFEGMEVKQIDEEEMALFGPVADQAALIGIVMKISRLNLKLRSINEIKSYLEREKE